MPLRVGYSDHPVAPSNRGGGGGGGGGGIMHQDLSVMCTNQSALLMCTFQNRDMVLGLV